MNKHFKATLFDDTDEDYLNNTFACYMAGIIVLVAVILDQWEWNGLTMLSTICLGIIMYKLGYRLGEGVKKR